MAAWVTHGQESADPAAGGLCGAGGQSAAQCAGCTLNVAPPEDEAGQGQKQSKGENQGIAESVEWHISRRHADKATGRLVETSTSACRQER